MTDQDPSAQADNNFAIEDDPPPAAEGSGAATPHPAGPGRAPRLLGYILTAIAGVAIGAAGLAFATGAFVPTAAPTPTPPPAAADEALGAPAGPAIGRPDAPVTIEVWADYQCVFCRLEHILFSGAVLREYVLPGIARVIHRDFAFLGQESIDAAIAARCAGRQEPAAQLRFQDTLYAFQEGKDQGRFSRENLVQMAELVGLPDTAAFRACLEDPAVAGEVAAETQTGREAGIDATPTVRLLGPGGELTLRGFSQDWPKLRDAVEEVRAAAP
jgi:protein-disulfide isomerase